MSFLLRAFPRSFLQLILTFSEDPRYGEDMSSYEKWFARLGEIPELSAWVSELRSESASWFSEKDRGDVGKWKDALGELPAVEQGSFTVVNGLLSFPSGHDVSRELLMQFHPWRKGPIQIGQTYIDTEWRSDWKWERLAAQIDLHDKTVLDIGCGNGYYLWRMLEAGARWALGIDPYVPYVMQFECMRHFAGPGVEAEILPLGVEALPRVAPVFDAVFSMGVLYHQKSPLEHLMHCRDLLAKGGELVLETIVLPPEFDQVTDCLVPEGRYAKMKNVNFLPSVSMLESWLRKARFREVQVLDVSKTSLDEQRSTSWMTFESLPEYLDPQDREQTIEGHPAPWRVVIKAQK